MPVPTFRSTPLAAVGVVAAVMLSGAAAWALSEAGSPTSVATRLIDDDSGHPLFTDTDDLVPGRARAACLAVAAGGGGPDDQVRLLVDDLTGRLAPQLGLEVLVGTGGRYGDCTGFTGSRIYQGTVAGLAALGQKGITSGWAPGPRSRRTFKFVVTLADESSGQGQQAGATFVWRLDGPGPEPTPSGSPTSSGPPGDGDGPGGGSGPGGSGGSGSGGSGSGGSGTQGSPVVPLPGGSDTAASEPTPSAGSGSTAEPSTSPTSPTSDAVSPFSPSGPLSPGSGGSGSDGSGGSGSDGADLRLTVTVPRQVGRTVVGVLARPQFTLLPILLAAAFMLLQYRIDARDPKLANASRTRRELTLAFPLEYGSAGYRAAGGAGPG